MATKELSVKDRLLAEAKALAENIEKAEAFTGTEVYASLDPIDRNLLQRQIPHMREYLSYVEARAARLE